MLNQQDIYIYIYNIYIYICLYTYTLHLLITYVCFYITLDPFPVVSLGYFVYNGIDATVASMGGRVDLPQDLFFLFFIGADFLADVCVWLNVH